MCWWNKNRKCNSGHETSTFRKDTAVNGNLPDLKTVYCKVCSLYSVHSYNLTRFFGNPCVTFGGCALHILINFIRSIGYPCVYFAVVSCEGRHLTSAPGLNMTSRWRHPWRKPSPDLVSPLAASRCGVISSLPDRVWRHSQLSEASGRDRQTILSATVDQLTREITPPGQSIANFVVTVVSENFLVCLVNQFVYDEPFGLSLIKVMD